jgi:hypothetical protein
MSYERSHRRSLVQSEEIGSKPFSQLRSLPHRLKVLLNVRRTNSLAKHCGFHAMSFMQISPKLAAFPVTIERFQVRNQHLRSTPNKRVHSLRINISLQKVRLKQLAEIPDSLVRVLLQHNVHFPQRGAQSFRFCKVWLICKKRVLLELLAQTQRVLLAGDEAVGSGMSFCEVGDQG